MLRRDTSQMRHTIADVRFGDDPSTLDFDCEGTAEVDSIGNGVEGRDPFPPLIDSQICRAFHETDANSCDANNSTVATNRREDSLHHHASSSSSESRQQQHVSRNLESLRRMVLQFSPCKPPNSCLFRITSEGIRAAY